VSGPAGNTVVGTYMPYDDDTQFNGYDDDGMDPLDYM
jgi:hypothetical protein